MKRYLARSIIGILLIGLPLASFAVFLYVAWPVEYSKPGDFYQVTTESRLGETTGYMDVPREYRYLEAVSKWPSSLSFLWNLGLECVAPASFV